jgi:NAD(P)H-dependent FMN reductase
MSAAKAVLLVGSPRGLQSVSRSLGQRLLDGLASRGLAVETHSIYAALDSPDKEEALISAAMSADLLVFSFPLYVDHLPAPVIQTLDRLAAGRRELRAAPQPRLAALVQCGFPETLQNKPALDILRRFAELNGFEWAGGLALGMGGAAGGRPLPEKPSGLLRNVLLAFDQAAAALAAGGKIPEETIALLAKPMMPKTLYFLAANWGWRQQARKNGRKAGRRIDLRARPYAQ